MIIYDAETDSYLSDLKYHDVNIEVFDVEESKDHLAADYAVLEEYGIENLVKDQFIPWVKGTAYKDRDNDKVFEGLSVDSIAYSYEKKD